MASKEEGDLRITAAELLAQRVLAAAASGSDIDDALSTGEEQIVPGEVSLQQRRAALRAMGAIQVWRGRGGAEVTPIAEQSAKDTISAARQVWQELHSRTVLTRDELKRLAAGSADSAAWLLKTLQLAVGRTGQQGGIQLLETAQREAAPPESTRERAGRVERAEQEEQETEKSWYPFAEAVLAELGFQTAITGEQSWGGGEWGTPDVVGYYVQPARSQLVPIRRVAAVEVKIILTRSSLAQAASYARFAHYVYLAVPQTVAEIDPDLRTECSTLGIGLFCRKQANSSSLHLLSDASWRPCDEEAVEALLERLRDQEGNSLQSVVMREVRREFLRALAEVDG